MDKNTVFLGLGTAGARIADRLPGVCAAALDTDRAALEGLTHIPEENRLFIGSDRTAAALAATDPKHLDWFPTEPLPDPRPLTGGTQGCRAAGRLCFYEAARAGVLSPLEALLIRQHELAPQEPLHIALIASLVGGTGSGSFMQLGMLLRRVCMDMKLGAVRIHAHLLLSNALPGTQAPLGTVNTCAALLELRSLYTLNAQGYPGLNFEYVPGKYCTHIRHLPFDECWLYDGACPEASAAPMIAHRCFGPGSDAMETTENAALEEIFRTGALCSFPADPDMTRLPAHHETLCRRADQSLGIRRSQVPCHSFWITPEGTAHPRVIRSAQPQAAVYPDSRMDALHYISWAGPFSLPRLCAMGEYALPYRYHCRVPGAATVHLDKRWQNSFG